MERVITNQGSQFRTVPLVRLIFSVPVPEMVQKHSHFVPV